MANANCGMQMLTPVRWTRVGCLALCILQLALLTACAKAGASELVPDGPPLATSAPPPRVITPADDVPVVSAPPNPSPEPTTTATAPPAKAPPPARPRAAESKTEPAPVAATPPITPPPATAEPLEVRSVPSAAAAAEEKKVRDVMNRAQADLKRVQEAKLSAEGKVQLAQAKRDAEQADEALKQKNFVFAMALAERAATLAAELAGR
jgi:hypothetical protein